MARAKKEPKPVAPAFDLFKRQIKLGDWISASVGARYGEMRCGRVTKINPSGTISAVWASPARRLDSEKTTFNAWAGVANPRKTMVISRHLVPTGYLDVIMERWTELKLPEPEFNGLELEIHNAEMILDDLVRSRS